MNIHPDPIRTARAGEVCLACLEPAPDGFCHACGSWRCACLSWQPAQLTPVPWLVDELACPCCTAVSERLGIWEVGLSVAVDEDLGAVVVRIHGLEDQLGGPLVIAPRDACDLALRLVGCARNARR